MIQNQGGDEFQPAGILKYVEDLKRVPNTEIGPKDYFEIACRTRQQAAFGFWFAWSRGIQKEIKEVIKCGKEEPELIDVL